ncbi:MAG: hypothetical protein WC640_00180 [Candidatus Paceibacterota bacterium]|jgi:hypothetical protein
MRNSAKSSYPYDLLGYFKYQARRAGWPNWQVQQIISEAKSADEDQFEETIIEALSELN